MRQHWLASLSDQNETYGRHVVADFAARLTGIETAMDIGAGGGDDIAIARKLHRCKTIAVEASPEFMYSWLPDQVDQIAFADIERDPLPAAASSMDLIIANQILEHTKEVFWIFDQMSKALKVGGHIILGVPNVASFHNRLLLLAGIQPTQHKLASAHVRPFSKRDTMKFLDACWPGGYSLQAFTGAQFYPLPRAMARPMAKLWPSAAFSIFFLLRKEQKYAGEFLAYPRTEALETNFWLGVG